MENHEGKQLLNFIGALYDAAADPSQWQSLTAKCARLFDSESCLLMAADLQTGGTTTLATTANLDSSFWAGYEAHYQRDDLWIAGGIARAGQSVLGQELAPHEWFRRSAFVNELCVDAGVYYLLGSVLPLGRDRMGILGIHRSEDQPSFDEVDRQRLEPLKSHVTRAIQLHLRLSKAGLDHEAALDGLERTGAATIAVDGNGLILFASRLAEATLRQGVGLQAIKGRLTASDRRIAARLAVLIRGATETAAGAASGSPGGSFAIDRGEGRLPLTVLVTPFRPKQAGFGAPLPAALVFIRDPEMPTLAMGILQDLFGLTPAQAAVATRLADGESLEQVSKTLRISPHTARDHLKTVFAKTGAARQSQLVALLTRTVAALASRGTTPHS